MNLLSQYSTMNQYYINEQIIFTENFENELQRVSIRDLTFSQYLQKLFENSVIRNLRVILL